MVKENPYDVVWTEAAGEDFQKIIDFIAQRNPERALELQSQIKTRVHTLAHFPFRSRLVPEIALIGLNVYREWIVVPYRVMFQIRGRRVIITGFFDGRRDLDEVFFERVTNP